MLGESQPLRIGLGGAGQLGGLGQVAEVQTGQRARTWRQHELDRVGDVWFGQSRGYLALGGREVAQAGIHADEDQRNYRVPFVDELRLLVDSPRGQRRLYGLFQLACHPVTERLKRREARGQPRVGRDLFGMIKQIKVVTAASRIAGQQQLGGQAEEAFRGLYQHRGVGHVQGQRHRRGRDMQEVGHDLGLQEFQGPVGPPCRQIKVGRSPAVPGRFEPLSRPRLERLLTGAVPARNSACST